MSFLNTNSLPAPIATSAIFKEKPKTGEPLKNNVCEQMCEVYDIMYNTRMSLLHEQITL